MRYQIPTGRNAGKSLWEMTRQDEKQPRESKRMSIQTYLHETSQTNTQLHSINKDELGRYDSIVVGSRVALMGIIAFV